MTKIQQNCIIPSSCYSVKPKHLKQYLELPNYSPRSGDLVYGEICHLGFHKHLESSSARLHTIHDRTRAIFVFGNRYAPDHYEGLVPEAPVQVVDMIARSGIVGKVIHKNELIAAPTRIKILGYLCDKDGKVVNTGDHILINAKARETTSNRAKLILCIGTAMNSGKSYAAAACCYALSSMGKTVRAGKITGTASLKDILLMQDCGASHIADFSFFGYPSTYMLDMQQLMHIFNGIDNKYGNNPKNYLVLEIADGILQRETRMLLENSAVQSRIHKLIFCAADAAGAAGGLQILRESFNLIPDAISGLCSSSPLALNEIQSFSEIPILKSIERDYKSIYALIH